MDPLSFRTHLRTLILGTSYLSQIGGTKLEDWLYYPPWKDFGMAHGSDSFIGVRFPCVSRFY